MQVSPFPRPGLSAAAEALPRVAADQCDLRGQQTALPRPQCVHSHQARPGRLLRGELSWTYFLNFAHFQVFQIGYNIITMPGAEARAGQVPGVCGHCPARGLQQGD